MHAASPFLRRTLVADAVISGLTGLVMLLGATMLDSLLGVPSALLRYAGLSLLPFAGFVAYLATRDTLPRAPVLAVIAVNAAWVAASILILVTGQIAPNVLGYAFVLVQALAVAVFAELQYAGLRQTVATAA